jgi:hypothetical protein
MRNQILKSNSAFVAIGDSPAFKAITEKESLRLFTLVQDCSFSVNHNRAISKQLGNQEYSHKSLIDAPDVDLKINYYASPYLINESLMGFQDYSLFGNNAFDTIKDVSNNFYLIIDPEDSKDGFAEVKKSTSNLNGCFIMGFGNCYLKNYSLDFNAGSLPIVSTSFACSNINTQNIYENVFPSPAVNLNLGQKQNGPYVYLTGLYESITGSSIPNNIENRNEFNPSIVVPQNVIVELNQLIIGGLSLSSSLNPLIQSFSMSIDFERVDLKGLGNNYYYNRKLKYPIVASISMNCLIDNMGDSSQDLIRSEKYWDFDLTFCDSTKLNTGFFSFTNAKLESFNYSLPVNEKLTFQASFTVDITDKKGFSMFRKVSKFQNSVWDTETSLWNKLNVFWDTV